jgi:hypothetical protein
MARGEASKLKGMIMTASGKISKIHLRGQLKDYVLPNAALAA